MLRTVEEVPRIQSHEGAPNPNYEGLTRLFQGCLSVCSSKKWRRGFCLLLPNCPWANHVLWASVLEVPLPLNGCLWGLSQMIAIWKHVAQSLARAEVHTGFLPLSFPPASVKGGTWLPEQATQRSLLEGFSCYLCHSAFIFLLPIRQGLFPLMLGGCSMRCFMSCLWASGGGERRPGGHAQLGGGGAVWEKAAAWPANEGGAGSSHRLREDRLSPQVDRREENHLQV